MRFLLFIAIPFILFGAKAMVSLDIERGQDFFVSKKFIAVLKVKTTAFSISNLDVDFKDNSNFVFIEPQSASYISSEEIQGESYQYSVYEYELYPLKANGVSLKPLKVSFDVSSGYGQPTVHFSLETSQKELFIKSPKDSVDFILATQNLTIQTEFSNNKAQYKIGDAISQTIEVTALDVPDILIPKVKYPTIEGLKLYKSESKLSQEKKDSHLVAKRIEKATYIFEREGNFTIPSYELEWYNVNDSKIMSAQSKDYSFEVIDDSIKEEEKTKEVSSSYEKYIYLVIAALIMLLLILLSRKIKQKRDENRYGLDKRMNPN